LKSSEQWTTRVVNRRMNSTSAGRHEWGSSPVDHECGSWLWTLQLWGSIYIPWHFSFYFNSALRYSSSHHGPMFLVWNNSWMIICMWAASWTSSLEKFWGFLCNKYHTNLPHYMMWGVLIVYPNWITTVRDESHVEMSFDNESKQLMALPPDPDDPAISAVNRWLWASSCTQNHLSCENVLILE